MADATLASQNAELASALIQDHHHNQAALGTALVAPQIGEGQDANAWVGGSKKMKDVRSR